jgi:RNA-directed DNA polymerase
MKPNMKQVAESVNIETALEHVVHNRRNHSHNNDIWHLCYKWDLEKPEIRRQLMDGSYKFQALRRYRIDGKKINSWSGRDAVVLKAVAMVLKPYFESFISTDCYHLKGPAGIKPALTSLCKNIKNYTFVCRSDVRSYYASIKHKHVMRLLKHYISDVKLLRLIRDYMKYCVCDGGNYYDNKQGICLGCPLSPLIGALYLSELDQFMGKQKDVFYARYMDDWVILTKTRWKLRGIVKKMNLILNKLEVGKHPDKTFIGRIDKGISFLGVYLTHDYLSVSEESRKKMQKKVAKLYEQGASKTRIGRYIANWQHWFENIYLACVIFCLTLLLFDVCFICTCLFIICGIL